MSSLHNQISGTHYKRCKIQPAEFIHANGLGYFEGCAIKYSVRHRDKGGADDIRKAIHYLEMLLELEYPEGPLPPSPETLPGQCPFCGQQVTGMVCECQGWGSTVHDWHEAVKEICNGIPNSAMMAEVVGTSAQPPTIRTNGVAFARMILDGGWQMWEYHGGQWVAAPPWCCEQAARWAEATPEQIAAAGVDA